MAKKVSSLKPPFPSLIPLTGLGGSVDTSTFFDSTFLHSADSPIDQYLKKTTKLNTFITPSNFDETLANLVLLGHVSAVESYFRALIRRIILIDPVAKEKVNECNVTYAAAIHHMPDMLPEALLEKVSFSSPKNLMESLRKFVGLEGDVPMDIKIIHKEFEKVCQLRHCIVHRFSMLGSSNAIDLGLDLHSKLIEKPIKLDYAKLQTLQQILDITVKAHNNFLFRYLIEKASDRKEWKWDYRIDRLKFNLLYDVFSSQLPPATLSVFKVYSDTRASLA